MSINNSSGFTINGGRFEHANNMYNNCTVVKVTKKKQEEQTILDDYNRVKTGDVCIERTIATPSSVRRDFHPVMREQYELWRNVDAQRSFNIARLEGRNTGREFLYVTYDGPDALKAFKRDFNQFAHVKKANVTQIFGYNDNERGLPALVFYDALIPLGRIILDGNRWKPVLFSYFSHQFGRMQRELTLGDLPVGELWVEPRTGALQKGPYLEPSIRSWIMVGTSENIMPNTHSTPLPIQTYSDNDTVLEYLTRTSTARTILTGICFADSGFIETLAHEQVIPVLSSLPGAIYNWRSRDIIARLPGGRERLRYGFWRVEGRIPGGMRESQVVMDDGSVRFTVTSTEIQELEGIVLRYDLHPLGKWIILAESWLAQAHSVFSQLGIHEDDWEDYGRLGSFVLCLERTSPHQEPNIPPNVYLFIRPVPRPSDDDAVWGSWLEGEKYFWSFDALGREMVPELVRAYLGLPSFACRIHARHNVWFPSHYNAVQKLHISQGFDSTTTDFALSLGFPIFEVIGDESRFEDLEDSTLSQAGDDFETRGESSTRPSSAKKPKRAVRTSQSTRSSPRLQQVQARKPDMKSPSKPQDLGNRANRKDAQAASSNQGETATPQRSRHHQTALGHRSTSTSSLGTSRSFEESSSESSSESTVEDAPEAQAGPSTGTSRVTTGRYYPRHREIKSFAVPNDTNAMSPETGLQPPRSRKQKHVDDLANVPRKKSRRIEHGQNNERKRREPSELDGDRPKKRRRGL